MQVRLYIIPIYYTNIDSLKNKEVNNLSQIPIYYTKQDEILFTVFN